MGWTEPDGPTPEQEAAWDYNTLREEADRLREALQTILWNTEEAAIKHRDYDHLAKDIADTARAALGEPRGADSSTFNALYSKLMRGEGLED